MVHEDFKTTLLRTLAGVLKPVTGTIALEGGNLEKSLAEHSHFVGHANAVKPHLTVKENIAFWVDYLDGQSGLPLDAALAHFGLSNLADFPVAYLSAGQRRRVSLARLLATRRPVWLLDEPAVSLDTSSSKRLAEAIDGHTEIGGIAIVATHVPLGVERARELQLGGGERRQ